MTEPMAPPRPEPGPLRPGPVAPPDTRMGGGNFLQNRTAGIPNWGWIVGGVIGGLVLLWWFRHGKQPDTDTSGGTGVTTNQTPYSMDIVGAQSSVLSQIRDLQGQLSTVQGQPGPQGPPGDQGPPGPIGSPAPTPTPTPTPTPAPTPTPTPAPAPAPASTPTAPPIDLSPKGRTVSVGTGANMYNFAESIYGSPLGINTLRALNPGFDTWITWSAPVPYSGGGTYKIPTLIKGRPINI